MEDHVPWLANFIRFSDLLEGLCGDDDSEEGDVFIEAIQTLDFPWSFGDAEHTLIFAKDMAEFLKENLEEEHKERLTLLLTELKQLTEQDIYLDLE